MSSIKLESNASGTGVFTIASPNSNTNRTLTLPDATGTIITTAGGAAISGTTGTFTGLVDISAAGAGQIQFPATQNASSNANTLDDYEEGTWTPELTYSTPGTLSVGYQAREGFYTKIGNVVHFACFVQLNAFTKGTASGTLRITGLPFTSRNPSNNETPISWSVYDTPLPTGAGAFPTPIVEATSTIISLIYTSNNGVNTTWPDADSSSQYKLNGKYFV